MMKQKRTALWVTVLADGGLLWFYLTAVFGMIASMLKLPISELLLLPAAVSVVFFSPDYDETGKTAKKEPAGGIRMPVFFGSHTSAILEKRDQYASKPCGGYGGSQVSL